MAQSISRLEDHLGYWLRYVSNHVSHAFSTKVEAYGVTVAEWVLLRTLWDLESASPSELSQALGMTRGAISKLIERICQKGLAIRSVSAGDRRCQSIVLTASGKKLVPQLAGLADKNDQEFFDDLPVEHKKLLKEILLNLIQSHGWKDQPLQ